MPGTRFTGKLRRFSELEGRDKWLLLHATVWLAMARIILIAVPFRKLATKLSGEQLGAKEEPDPKLLERIGFAVRAASNNVFWRSDCFPQSIAGWMLLRHHGYRSTIHLGVERIGEDELRGHAWLTCGDIVVTGGEGLDRYAETHRLGA